MFPGLSELDFNFDFNFNFDIPDLSGLTALDFTTSYPAIDIPSVDIPDFDFPDSYFDGGFCEGEKNSIEEAKNLIDFASTASHPPPPNDPNSKGTQTISTTVYNKNGIRIDVENPGNRMGQIHLQKGVFLISTTIISPSKYLELIHQVVPWLQNPYKSYY